MIKKFIFHSYIDMSNELLSLLSEHEEAKFCVKTFRDIAVFTDKRVLVVDKQGLTGKKKEYFSIPYKSIITYAIETAGTFDLDSEIKLTFSGGIEIELQFAKNKEMNDLLIKVYHLINDYILLHS